MNTDSYKDKTWQEISENDLRWNLSGAEIESESFRIIEAEFPPSQRAKLSENQWQVVRRLIHTTADMHIAEGLVFNNDAIEKGQKALKNCAHIICDSKMIRSGISLDKLKKINANYSEEKLICTISDADIIEQAKKENKTRALCSAEKVRPLMDNAIILVGNAPLSLARFARYILEEGARPALVIGMPVGFVNVVESKQLLAKTSCPHIALMGRRGGSALAVTTLHAIMEDLLVSI